MIHKKLLFLFLLLICILPVSSDTVHIGIYENPPYILRDNNNYSGTTIDIINYIAEREDLDIQYHFSSYEAGLDMMTLGLIDIIPEKFYLRKSDQINNYTADYYNPFKKQEKSYSGYLYREPGFIFRKEEISGNCNSELAKLFKNNIYDLKKTESDLYNNFIESNSCNNPSVFLKSWTGTVLLLIIIINAAAVLIYINLHVFNSVNITGREIISEFESPELFETIHSKIKNLILSDYFCIGQYNSSTLLLNVYGRNALFENTMISEKIDSSESCFIYALRNRKTVYIKNIKTDLLRYTENKSQFIKIAGNIKSAIIIPLIFNGEIMGAAAFLDIRKRAYTLRKRILFNSLSKYMTIALKNRKLIEKNIELLDCIEKDKNKILKAKQEVEYIAQHDPLTNLPNRLYLNEFLNQSIKKSNRTGKKLAVLFIDMDNFKEVNDTYGHQTGDKVLIAAANRFKNLLRESDIVIRFAGDEFIIILEDINSTDDVKQVAGKILKTCSSPVLTENADLSLSFSIGISLYPDNGSNSEELIRKADIALYSVKNSIKGNWKFF